MKIKLFDDDRMIMMNEYCFEYQLNEVNLDHIKNSENIYFLIRFITVSTVKFISKIIICLDINIIKSLQLLNLKNFL